MKCDVFILAIILKMIGVSSKIMSINLLQTTKRSLKSMILLYQTFQFKEYLKNLKKLF